MLITGPCGEGDSTQSHYVLPAVHTCEEKQVETLKFCLCIVSCQNDPHIEIFEGRLLEIGHVICIYP